MTEKHISHISQGFPYIQDVPDEIELIYTETMRQTGPLGSCGCVELPLTSPHVAIINAIYNATKVRIFELPASNILWDLQCFRYNPRMPFPIDGTFLDLLQHRTHVNMDREKSGTIYGFFLDAVILNIQDFMAEEAGLSHHFPVFLTLQTLYPSCEKVKTYCHNRWGNQRFELCFGTCS